MSLIEDNYEIYWSKIFLFFIFFEEAKMEYIINTKCLS